MRQRRQFLAVLEQRKALLDFIGLRKASGVLFGEEQTIAGKDVKLPAAAFGDLNLLAKTRLD